MYCGYKMYDYKLATHLLRQFVIFLWISVSLSSLIWDENFERLLVFFFIHHFFHSIPEKITLTKFLMNFYIITYVKLFFDFFDFWSFLGLFLHLFSFVVQNVQLYRMDIVCCSGVSIKNIFSSILKTKKLHVSYTFVVL